PMRDGQRILMYSTTWCGDCRRAKRVFAALGVDCTEINVEENEAAAALVMQLNDGMRSVPTILFPDGSMLVEPSSAELEAKLATEKRKEAPPSRLALAGGPPPSPSKGPPRRVHHAGAQCGCTRCVCCARPQDGPRSTQVPQAPIRAMLAPHL